MLKGHKLHTNFNKLHPAIALATNNTKADSEEKEESDRRTRYFQAGDPVYYKKYWTGKQ
jgi:hypothetical protein